MCFYTPTQIKHVGMYIVLEYIMCIYAIERGSTRQRQIRDKLADSNCLRQTQSSADA
jgi:hypothetical protein